MSEEHNWKNWPDFKGIEIQNDVSNVESMSRINEAQHIGVEVLPKKPMIIMTGQREEIHNAECGEVENKCEETFEQEREQSFPYLPLPPRD